LLDELVDTKVNAIRDVHLTTTRKHDSKQTWPMYTPQRS